VKDLVIEIAKALVDLPEEVVVREVEGEQVTVLELRVAPSDLGKYREAGPDCKIDPDSAGRGRNEIEPAVHSGNPGVTRFECGRPSE